MRSREQEFLQQLVGEWRFEAEDLTHDDTGPEKHPGTESVRSLGESWVVCDMRNDHAPDVSVMILGYDPSKERFVGTFVSSMLTHLWIYGGSLDASGATLTLDCEGPSLSDPNKTVPYQDTIEMKGADERVLSSRALGPDGKWQQFMRSTYRRILN